MVCSLFERLDDHLSAHLWQQIQTAFGTPESRNTAYSNEKIDDSGR